MTHKHIHLTIRNRYGSVQHYYHFLLGMLVPLVLRLEAQDPLDPAVFVVRSCGPLDRHLRAIEPAHLVIVDPETHEAMKSDPARSAGSSIVYEELQGHDDASGRAYDRSILTDAAAAIRRRLGEDIPRHPVGVELARPGPRVLFIGRSVDPFYDTAEAEIRTSGAQRRSIPNFVDVSAALQQVFPDLQTLTLEQLSLAQQIACFETTDLVIAQHGAALANLLFSRPATKVPEILPPVRPVNCFGGLALTLGLGYRCLVQTGPHAIVDPAAVVAAATEWLSIETTGN
jgi:hypothetical protein